MAKNKKSPYWFSAKKYGYGWTPTSWQAWSVLLTYVIVLLSFFFKIDKYSGSRADTLTVFAPYLMLFTATLFIVCWRTGEPLKWRWGGKKR